MARARTVVAAHCVVYVNGRLFGRVASLGFSAETPQRELRVIDTLEPAELIPQGASVRGSLTIYRLHRDGGIEAAGLAAAWADMTRQKYFSLMVVDRVTDTVLFRADRCATAAQSWNVGRGFVMGTVAFVGLNWSNETVPAPT